MASVTQPLQKKPEGELTLPPRFENMMESMAWPLSCTGGVKLPPFVAYCYTCNSRHTTTTTNSQPVAQPNSKTTLRRGAARACARKDIGTVAITRQGEAGTETHPRFLHRSQHSAWKRSAACTREITTAFWFKPQSQKQAPQQAPRNKNTKPTCSSNSLYDLACCF